MKRLILGISAMVTVSGGGALADGVSNGGGGGTAVVCRSPVTGEIERATLLDLFEAENVFGFRLQRPTGDVAKDFFRASVHSYFLEGTTRIGGFEQAMIDASFQRFFDIAVQTGPLPRLRDTGEVPVLPDGCELEQLAIFYDQEPAKVEINRGIWEHLDSLSRAALVTHELFYHRERRYEETTSESTRASVAHIYAASGVAPLLDGVPFGAFTCVGEDPRFIHQPLLEVRGVSSSRFSNLRIFPTDSGVRLQFLQLAGRSLITKTAVDIPGLAFAFVPRPRGDALRQELIASAPGKSLDIELPLKSPVRKNWRVEFHYKTGDPIRLRVRSGDAVLSEEFLTSCD